jgi:hypothetical protein
MAMTEKGFALVFSGVGANDAVRGQMQQYANALEESGLPVVNVNPAESAEIQYAVELASRGEVRFAFSWLGVAQDLKVQAPGQEPRNMWDLLRIPLLKLQGDLPAYYAERHRDVPRHSVNLYGPSEFVHFRRRWMPEATSLSAVVPPLPLDPMDRKDVDLRARRSGKLVFLKNGNAPDELTGLWNERLPKPVTALLLQMAEEITPRALAPGVLHLGDFAHAFLQDRGIDVSPYRSQILFFSAQLDDYLRRVKSRMIAEVLLDFPVIIQGAFWHHLSFEGRPAKLREGMDYESTRAIYRRELGIVDMSPNVDTSPHERVQRAAGSYTLFLTNRQGWLDERFSASRELAFEFTRQSIAERVDAVLSEPDRYLQLALDFGEQFHRDHSAAAFANSVRSLADLATLDAAQNKPQLQPFFIWSRPTE